MFSLLTHYVDKNGVTRKLSAAGLKQLKRDYTELSRKDYRALMVTQKIVTEERDYAPSDETDLAFTGYVAFIDPPKASAKESLDKLSRNGIEIKIISGDDPLVGQKVVSELDLPIKGILTGDRIAKMSRLQLRHAVENTTIFARVNPSQKMSIIEELRRLGHVVGYTGDGINVDCQLHPAVSANDCHPATNQ